jgi:hypothetical protein
MKVLKALKCIHILVIVAHNAKRLCLFLNLFQVSNINFFYGFVPIFGFVPFEVDPFIGVAIARIYIQPIIPLPP